MILFGALVTACGPGISPDQATDRARTMMDETMAVVFPGLPYADSAENSDTWYGDLAPYGTATMHRVALVIPESADLMEPITGSSDFSAGWPIAAEGHILTSGTALFDAGGSRCGWALADLDRAGVPGTAALGRV